MFLTSMKEKMANFNAVLSPLEQNVLQILWPDKKLRVKEIQKKFSGKKAPLSSVAVICDRLHDKGLLKRDIEKSDKACIRYVYYPAKDKTEFETAIIEKTVNKLLDAFGKTAAAYFNERFKK